ncbi:MAG: hypothetical protein AAGC57_00275 [Pseudomonadota bacterium]
MLTMLRWVGARARWVLAIGVMIASILPDLSALLRPFMPVLVSLVFCVAMVRIDLRALLLGMAKPRRLVRLSALTIALLWVTPATVWAAGQGLGLAPDLLAALVYTGASPPITSAAGLCLLLGLNAALALELTIFASLLAPFLGPLVVTALLGEAVPIEAVPLALRMAAMIAAGAVASVLLRHLIGSVRIEAEHRAFDGVAALVMLSFVIPLFDGFWHQVLDEPALAGALLILAIVVNYGAQIILAQGMPAMLGAASAGALGLAWGNRTVALYLAALPPDPVFGLYVALYQIPMLLTPLVMGRVLGARYSNN